jgi:hypothetical protein
VAGGTLGAGSATGANKSTLVVESASSGVHTGALIGTGRRAGTDE